MSRILVVDDEESICWSFRELLGEEGHDVRTAASAPEAMDLAAAGSFDAMLLDVRLPGMDGLTALPELRRHLGPIPVVVMTAFGDLETAVRTVEAGAFDYLVKPFDLDRASDVVRRALESSRHARRDPEPVAATHARETLIGSSAIMQEVFQSIAMAAPADVPVLITGESGTGKELVARALHRYGTRKDGPFVVVALPSLNPSSVEGDLVDPFERADGGTILLDEVGDAAPELQVKLLRAIENRETTRQGLARSRPLDLRVVATTHRPLTELVAAGTFREDLYFRLTAFPIRVPPLRERVADIAELAEFFLRLSRPSGDHRLSAEILAALQARSWPGNVRELRNAIEHAVIVSRGASLRPEHLPAPGMPAATSTSTLQEATTCWSEIEIGRSPSDLHDRFLRSAEPALLKAVLAHCDGNRAAAAAVLGIDRATLRLKLRRYGIDG